MRWTGHPRLAWVALAVAAVSLLVNLYLVLQLRRPERWAVSALERVLAQEGGTFRYDVRIPPGTPLQLDVPVDERIAIRVDTTLPIDTRVRIPIRSPLGSYDVSAPIRADVPIRTTLPLRIRHTFRLRTRTTSEIVVPLEIRLSDLPWATSSPR